MKITYTIHDKPEWCNQPYDKEIMANNCFFLRNGLISNMEDCKNCVYKIKVSTYVDEYNSFYDIINEMED